MEIRDILKCLKIKNTTIEESTTIYGVTHLECEIEPNVVFFDVSGNCSDEVSKSVTLVFSEKNSHKANWITVNDIYDTYFKVLDLFYQNPLRNIKLVGITGSDGKSTTGKYLKHFIEKLNFLECEDCASTPFINHIYEAARNCVEQKQKFLAIEIDDKGLKDPLINRLKFDYTIFTNLNYTKDSSYPTTIDYLKGMQILFDLRKDKGIGIISSDDDFYQYFAHYPNMVCYGEKPHSDFKLSNVHFHYGLITFDIETVGESFFDLFINKSEKYHLNDSMPGFVIGFLEGISNEDLTKKIKSLPKLSGNLEPILSVNNFKVYHDNAQTPASLACILKEAKKQSDSEIIVVCASESKDPNKRSQIGEIAMELAEYVVFTSNTHENDSKEAIESLVSFSENRNYAKILNRKDALKHACSKVDNQHTLVITGELSRSDLIIEDYLRLKK